MSIIAATLTDGIRVGRATQKGSVDDVISVVTNATSAYAVRILSRIQKQYPENMRKMSQTQNQWQGQGNASGRCCNLGGNSLALSWQGSSIFQA